MSAGEPLIVAIDGPAGTGKSTAARLLARRLGVPYLDTGAMYRAVALAVLRAGLDPGDRAAVEALAGGLALELAPAGGDPGDPGQVDLEVRLAGEPVEREIRAPEVGRAASAVAAHPGVRRRLVELQRAAARLHGGVLEGRDIGTRVFPHTPHKFYLDAHPEVRHRRRHRQLQDTGRPVSLEQVADEMDARDRRDAARADSPLRHDDSYRLLDTSERTIEQVVAAMAAAVGE